MSHVLVIGAGLSGCTAAKYLADQNIKVSLIEKSDRIGGKVRSYGCKAVDKCQNCGVCLSGSLWDKVLSHPGINILFGSKLENISGKSGNFTVTLRNINITKDEVFNNITAVLICTGFESKSNRLSSHLQIEDTTGILTGTQLEELMFYRSKTGLFNTDIDYIPCNMPGNIQGCISDNVPSGIAFIQCTGSRDVNEGGLYCSRVCCSYSTRSAKVFRSYYPECKIVFFYMEMQNVEFGNYFTGLQELDMEFINCRPLRIKGGTPVTVEYDAPSEGIKSRTFDLVVLSDGIHACSDNDHIAEICNIGQDRDGFLQETGSTSGIFVSGCAKAPMKIDEAYADSIAAAGRVLNMIQSNREKM